MSLQEDFLSAADRGDPGGRWPPADAVGATELCVAVVEALASVAGQGDGEGGSDGAEGAAVLEAARCVLERHEAFSENELMRVAAAVGSLGGGETGHDADATAFLADMAVELRGRWPRVGLVAGVMSGNLMVADAVLSQSGMRHLGAAVEELLRGKVTGSYGTLVSHGMSS